MTSINKLIYAYLIFRFDNSDKVLTLITIDTNMNGIKALVDPKESDIIMYVNGLYQTLDNRISHEILSDITDQHLTTTPVRFNQLILSEFGRI